MSGSDGRARRSAVMTSARPGEGGSVDPTSDNRRPAAGIGRLLIRILVRVLLALGLAVLAIVFLEAWLPGVVVETLGSWLAD